MEKQRYYDELNEVIKIKTNIENLSTEHFSFVPDYAVWFKTEKLKNFWLWK